MDFVESFVEATESITSPKLFRTWGGIYTLAAAMNRHVWVKIQGTAIFPNIFVILVAPPGIGKSTTITRVRDLLQDLPTVHLAPTDISKAGLIDDLYDAKVQIEKDGEVLSYNSLHIVSSEFGTLMDKYDRGLMAVLTDLYDCGPYTERKRGKGERLSIPQAQVSILAGDTPSHLFETLPEGAWTQGFVSRTFLVYSSEEVRANLFDSSRMAIRNEKELMKHLEVVATHTGELKFTPEAMELLNAWHLEGGPPKPEHPRLATYVTRRTLHLVKLTMIACASRGGFPEISEADIETGMAWLFSLEMAVGEMFAAAQGEMAQAAQEVGYMVAKMSEKTGSPVPEPVVLRLLLTSNIPASTVQMHLDGLVKSGILQRQVQGGRRFYLPAKD